MRQVSLRKTIKNYQLPITQNNQPHVACSPFYCADFNYAFCKGIHKIEQGWEHKGCVVGFLGSTIALFPLDRKLWKKQKISAPAYKAQLSVKIGIILTSSTQQNKQAFWLFLFRNDLTFNRKKNLHFLHTFIIIFTSRTQLETKQTSNFSKQYSKPKNSLPRIFIT